jgi:predicted nucleotidyltransferase
MIKPSLITLETKAYIREKLLRLSEAHNIRIILAIESGSRAWGFPSKNSDFDVRFIYHRSQDDYLSIQQRTDVIEAPITEDEYLGVPFDLNGWDVRKALQLALKSNAVLIEWLQSPLQYMIAEDTATNLLNFARSNVCLPSLEYHYDRLARHAWAKVSQNESMATVKTYCYTLRPTLVLAWLRLFKEVPPMDMHNLSRKLPLGQELIGIISQLIILKAACNEKDQFSREPILDDYINHILAEKVPRPSTFVPSEANLHRANEIFKEIIL